MSGGEKALSGGKTAVSIIGLIAGAVSLWLIPKSLRTFKRLKDDDFTGAWRGVDRERKRAIRKAMRQGVAVEDPQDAALALRLASRVEQLRGVLRPIELLYTAVLVGLLIIGLSSPEYRFLAWLSGCSFGVTALLWPPVLHQRRRMRRSAQATGAWLGMSRRPPFGRR